MHAEIAACGMGLVKIMMANRFLKDSDMTHNYQMTFRLFVSLVAGMVGMASNAQTVKDIVLGTNNLSIQEVTLQYNGTTDIQTSGASGVETSTALPVQIQQIVVDDNGTDVVLDFFNTEGVEIRNNNFSGNVSGVGVYNQGTTTPASNQSAWESAMVDVVNDKNMLNYMFYDNSSNLPSGDDFDVNWLKGLTEVDYFVVQERDGNTYFTLTPLGADGNPITEAKALRFGFQNGVSTGNGSQKYDWNTGYAPSNFSSQPMMFSVVEVAEFESPETIYGIRIDNNGDADVKFYGLSEEDFASNPGNPLYTCDISGTIWNDEDGDQTIDQSETERGFGVKVYLYEDADNDGVLDAGESTPIDSLTTGSDGHYIFSPRYNSGTQSYITAIATESLPYYYGLTTNNIETASFNAVGQTDANNDFGYNLSNDYVLVNGTVWEDEDEDQVLDGSESGRIANVKINLYEDTDGDGVLDAGEETVLEYDYTDATGYYEIARPYNASIDYIVQIDTLYLPANHSLTTSNVETASFSSGGSIDADNDFGYAKNSGMVGISGTIWLDNDEDQYLHESETGRADNVTVYLYQDDDEDGVLDASENTPVATTTTNSSGYYLFNRNFVGSGSDYAAAIEYSNGITNENNALGAPGSSFAEFYSNSDDLILELGSTVNTGNDYTIYLGNKTAGNDAEVIVSESTDGINFYYTYTIDVTSTSGDGYTVTAGRNTQYLKFDKGSINTVSGYTTQGSASGSVNDYKVYGVEIPSSANNAYLIDTDLNGYPSGTALTTDNLETANFNNAGEVDKGNDFGYNIESSSVVISGIVWQDDDGDGEIDAFENTRADNVTVNLYEDTDGDGVLDPSENTALTSTTTNASGYYQFERTFNTSTVHATAVEYENGINNASSALGTPGSTFAEFYSNSNDLILELGEEVANGDAYELFLANRNTGSNAEVIISESSDGVNFTYAHTITVTSDSKAGYEVTAENDTRYIKFDKGSINSVSGYNVSGSASGSTNDYKIYGVEKAGSGLNDYIVQTDFSSYPNHSNLTYTTDNQEVANFAVGGSIDRNNNFGYQDPIALPVEWLLFNVKTHENGQALVEWATAMELYNDYFIVERSLDGVHFEAIAMVESKAPGGNSQMELYYDFTDNTLSNTQGHVYYRVKQIDFDGQFDYTHVESIELNMTQSFTVSLFPNPTATNVQVTSASITESSPLKVEIYNMKGMLVKQGVSNSQIDVSFLESGIYNVVVSGHNQHTIERLVIQ